MRKIKTLNEFLATETKPKIKEPETAPKIVPSRPSPIRRGKPAVETAPKAEAEDVLQRFLYELKKRKGEKVEVNIEKIRSKYAD